jgi:signal transduction histidine kinase
MNLFHAHPWPSLANCKDLLFGSVPERLIALSRLAFCCFALFAVYVDPTRPASYLDETQELLMVYLIYSLLILYISSTRNLGPWPQYLIHMIDIAVLSLAVSLTDGVASPFFTFYTFTVFTATMRWGWRGAFSTAAILAVLFIGLSWDDIEFKFDRDSRMNILVMRTAYLFVTAAMLGYFGAYMERSRKRLSRLAAWPLEEGALGTPSPVGPLRHASNVLGARLVLVVWWENSTRRKRVAYWSPEGSGVGEVEAPAQWADFAERQTRANFFSMDAMDDGEWMRSLAALASRIELRDGSASSEAPRSYALAPFRGLHYAGCVVVIDPRYHSEDIVALTEIVAVRIGSDLEREALTREVAEAAIAQERGRVARDMHDSVLQDLTAASLMLKSATAHPKEDLSAPLTEIGWLLANQQRRIRTFIEGTSNGASASRQLLSEQLSVLLSTLERQWRCKLSMSIVPPDLRLTGSMATEIFQLVCEATANAVRHGRARNVSVEITEGPEGLQIRLEDDGAGLPTNEDGVALVEPRSIQKRVAHLKGTLNLESASVGAHLSIRIPAQ